MYILLFISIKEERRVFPHCDLCIYSLFLWIMRSNVSNLFDVERKKTWNVVKFCDGIMYRCQIFERPISAAQNIQEEIIVTKLLKHIHANYSLTLMKFFLISQVTYEMYQLVKLPVWFGPNFCWRDHCLTCSGCEDSSKVKLNRGQMLVL